MKLYKNKKSKSSCTGQRYRLLQHRQLGLTQRHISTLSIFTNPSARAGYDTRSIFNRSFTGLNSEFSFSKTSCLTKAEETSLPNYLLIAGGRIIGFIPFPRVLVQCEMQSVSSRIWTRVDVSISYDDNHYTTGTSTLAPYLSIFFLDYVLWTSTDQIKEHIKKARSKPHPSETNYADKIALLTNTPTQIEFWQHKQEQAAGAFGIHVI